MVKELRVWVWPRLAWILPSALLFDLGQGHLTLRIQEYKVLIILCSLFFFFFFFFFFGGTPGLWRVSG